MVGHLASALPARTVWQVHRLGRQRHLVIAVEGCPARKCDCFHFRGRPCTGSSGRPDRARDYTARTRRQRADQGTVAEDGVRVVNVVAVAGEAPGQSEPMQPLR